MKLFDESMSFVNNLGILFKWIDLEYIWEIISFYVSQNNYRTLYVHKQTNEPLNLMLLSSFDKFKLMENKCVLIFRENV